MGAKLREIKQQLRERMHDPVRQTGQWLKSVVQGYYHYYAVPGNIDSLSVFRDRLTGHWWQTLRRRSQKRRLTVGCLVCGRLIVKCNCVGLRS
jgi:RNA-directed DNA polymerase